MMSAVRTIAAMSRSSTPVCRTVTAALQPGRFNVSRLASGRPMVTPRPMMTVVAALDGDVVRMEEAR